MDSLLQYRQRPTKVEKRGEERRVAIIALKDAVTVML